jgi:hypothetical protein
MKKLLTSFLITVFLIELLVRFTPYPWILEPSFSQMGSLRSIETEYKNKNPKIVILGNSLIRDAISPTILSSELNMEENDLINLGVSAGNYFLDYKVLQSLNQKPELIILQIDLNRFINDEIFSSYYFIKLSKLEDVGILPENFSYSKYLKNIIFKSYASSDIWHRYIFQRNESEKIGTMLPKDELGQFDIYRDRKFLNEGFYQLENYIDGVEKIRNSNNFYYFKNICSYSKSQNINIVLLHLPLKSNEIDKNIQKSINEYFEFLLTECEAKKTLINNIDFKFLESEIFLDYGHLNNLGAKEYSKNVSLNLKKVTFKD